MRDPLCKVVYIFEREGDHGGGYWWLVLDCGHVVSRRRPMFNHWHQQINVLFRGPDAYLAPERVRCHSCGLGQDKLDPAIAIAAFGGPTL